LRPRSLGTVNQTRDVQKRKLGLAGPFGLETYQTVLLFRAEASVWNMTKAWLA